MLSKNIGFTLWLDIFKKISPLEMAVISIFFYLVIFLFSLLQIFFLYRDNIFHAFENLKIKLSDFIKQDNLYIEITIPKDSETTAFQIQQKLLKTFHSVYKDPIDGKHGFSQSFYFFQKLFKFVKVRRAKQFFFNLQIWAEYPYISFRLRLPKAFFERLEKAIFNAYPNAEISLIEEPKVLAEISKYQKSYLSYGQTTIEGNFEHRFKTFKDLSSDPVNSMVATMEALSKGQFMVLNLTASPVSHYFNQVIHYLIEEKQRQKNRNKIMPLEQVNLDEASEFEQQEKIAELEKMKASLFKTVISYWTISSSPEDAESKLSNIQAVLTEVNQKNMNMLKHKKLFTKQVDDLKQTGQLEKIFQGQPILKQRGKFWPFGTYKNQGQIISDVELYTLWHLPNTNEATVSSLKMVKFKKKPASQEMQSFPNDYYLTLGKSNFRMQEKAQIGIPTWEDMKKHLYILGGTGSGKPETLKTILSGILQKQGKEKTALLIIDPKNDFATDLLTMIPEDRKDDVIYFNPSKQKDRPLSFPFFAKFSGQKSNEERVGFLISIMKRFVQIDAAASWGPERVVMNEYYRSYSFNYGSSKTFPWVN